MGSRNEPVVLSYHDIVIYESDLRLLDGPHWLNDTIIGFYMQYLEEEAFSGLANVCFVSPEVTQCLKMSPTSEFYAFLDPLRFSHKAFAVMPLNDCDSAATPGGSHWSLLVFSRPQLTFYHLDSSEGCNRTSGERLSSKLADYLNLKNWQFVPLESLQQTNSYDCGVFVLCNLENVLRHISSIPNDLFANIDRLDQSTIKRKRMEIKYLIASLRTEMSSAPKLLRS